LVAPIRLTRAVVLGICVAWVLAVAGAPSANPGLGEPGGSEGSCLESSGATYGFRVWVEGVNPFTPTEAHGVELPSGYVIHVEPRKLAQLEVFNDCSKAFVIILGAEGLTEPLYGIVLPGTHVTLDRKALAELGLGGLKITSHGTGGTGTYPDDFVGVPISFVIGPAP
jgi:hypothetical protein